MAEQTPKAVARITSPLLAEAAVALDNIRQQLGLSVADAVNRALTTYAYFMALQNTGGEIYIKESPDGDMHRLLVHREPDE
jgi:hypothetical protein